jgi:hypothetical protein
MSVNSSGPVERLLHETLCSLRDAAGRFPPARFNRRPSPGAVWRWVRDGIRLSDGRVVRLEAIRVCGRWLTSDEALTRFVTAQQTCDHANSQSPGKNSRSLESRQRASDRAAAELDRLDA